MTSYRLWNKGLLQDSFFSLKYLLKANKILAFGCSSKSDSSSQSASRETVIIVGPCMNWYVKAKFSLNLQVGKAHCVFIYTYTPPHSLLAEFYFWKCFCFIIDCFYVSRMKICWHNWVKSRNHAVLDNSHKKASAAHTKTYLLTLLPEDKINNFTEYI